MLSKTFCISVSIAVLNVCFPASLSAADELPVYGKVPDFSFTERSGNEMTLADLKGKVWIADFIFTRCQGMCPLMTGRMAALEDQLAGTGIQMVSFSVDPDHDTPKVLSEYAAQHQASRHDWWFLTGRKARMWNFITEGFSLGVAQATAEDLAQGAEPVMHSNRFVLVDREGYVRGYYDSSEPAKIEALVRDALELL